MRIIESVTAKGHPLVKATHPTTLMITRDCEIGPRGDCIVAVAADKGAADLSSRLKRAIRAGRSVKVIFKVGGAVAVVSAWGHRGLALSDARDMVIRKSSFVCGRTLAVKADNAAIDLPRDFVARLRNPSAKVQITIEVV